MSEHWFKLYDGIVDDAKVQRLRPRLFKFWINLLCLTSRFGGKLPSIEQMSLSLRCSHGSLLRHLRDLKKVGLLDGEPENGAIPHNWQGRQRVQSSSAERVKRFRERHATQDVTHDVTHVTPVDSRDKNVEGRVQKEEQKEERKEETSLLRSSCPEPSQAHGQQVLEIDDELIMLPTNMPGQEVAVTAFQASEYRKLYPAVDLEQELRAMRGWLLSNPKLRKTKSGMMRFINNWLSKAQNRGKGNDHGRRQERGHSAFLEGAFNSANDTVGNAGREP